MLSFSYALYVVDNRNLQELWNWESHKKLEIANGKIFFHLNPKLCIDKIRKLESVAKLSLSDPIDVSLMSNGDRIACKFGLACDLMQPNYIAIILLMYCANSVYL